MKNILILVNHENVIYNFRKELISKLIFLGYGVILSSPDGNKIRKLYQENLIHESINIQRRGKNLYEDLKLIFHYRYLVKKYKPSLILSFTIKPNLYGSIISKFYNIPIITTITGLGSVFFKKNILTKLIIYLYRILFNSSDLLVFQNNDNMEFLLRNKIHGKNRILVNGSGVNLKDFPFMQYVFNEKLKFLYIGRVIQEKGIDLYLEAARTFSLKYSNVEFHIVGEITSEYSSKVEIYSKSGFIQYHGVSDDLLPFYKTSSAVVNPSFHEGMSNVLLEGSACGRACIASDIPGCREIIENNVSGFLFEPGNQVSFERTLEKFVFLSSSKKSEMGEKARKIIELNFSRDIVINSYISNISSIIKSV